MADNDRTHGRARMTPREDLSWLTDPGDVPSFIGRYRVHMRLGGGLHGSVFLATDTESDEPVAIKLLSDEGSLSEFENLIKLSSDLGGMINTKGSGTHEGRPFFVMHYLKRGSLGDRLHTLGRRPTSDEVLNLAGQLAAILGQLHRLGYLHLDVKPDNLLLDLIPSADEADQDALIRSDECVVLGDYATVALASEVSVLGTGRGTPGYGAWELSVAPDRVSEATDVYSAAVVAVEAITGQGPSRDSKPGQCPFDDSVLDQTAPFDVVLRASLRQNPLERPQSMTAWLAALSACVPVEKQARPGPRWLALAAALVVMAVGATVLFSSPLGRSQDQEVATDVAPSSPTGSDGAAETDAATGVPGDAADSSDGSDSSLFRPASSSGTTPSSVERDGTSQTNSSTASPGDDSDPATSLPTVTAAPPAVSGETTQNTATTTAATASSSATTAPPLDPAPPTTQQTTTSVAPLTTQDTATGSPPVSLFDRSIFPNAIVCNSANSTRTEFGFLKELNDPYGDGRNTMNCGTVDLFKQTADHNEGKGFYLKFERCWANKIFVDFGDDGLNDWTVTGENGDCLDAVTPVFTVPDNGAVKVELTVDGATSRHFGYYFASYRE